MTAIAAVTVAASIVDLDYGEAAGSLALREAICTHVRRSRAVNCDPSQVIVVNGSQQALDLVARVLIEPGDRVAIEDPAYQGTREILRAADARLVPVSVDRDGLGPDDAPDESSSRLRYTVASVSNGCHPAVASTSRTLEMGEAL